jgi:pyruvate carboxylase
LPAADLPALRAAARAKVGHELADPQFASYLMYPQVFQEFDADQQRFGDVSQLPTMAFFYGLEPGQEISIDLERGKTLIVRYVTRSEPHEDGTRTVFFELNGQPRAVRITDRSTTPSRPPQRRIEPGNRRHIGAPMPGTVTTVAVAVGQKVAPGDVVVTLEAMKMQTAVRADFDGVVSEVLVGVSSQVDAKDLLVVLG